MLISYDMCSTLHISRKTWSRFEGHSLNILTTVFLLTILHRQKRRVSLSFKQSKISRNESIHAKNVTMSLGGSRIIRVVKSPIRDFDFYSSGIIDKLIDPPHEGKEMSKKNYENDKLLSLSWI